MRSAVLVYVMEILIYSVISPNTFEYWNAIMPSGRQHIHL